MLTDLFLRIVLRGAVYDGKNALLYGLRQILVASSRGHKGQFFTEYTDTFAQSRIATKFAVATAV